MDEAVVIGSARACLAVARRQTVYGAKNPQGPSLGGSFIGCFWKNSHMKSLAKTVGQEPNRQQTLWYDMVVGPVTGT